MRRSAVRELLRLTAQPGMISFAGGLPAPELFPRKEASRAAELVLQQQGSRALQYGETEGVAELRDWVAGQFSRHGLRVGRANVLITTGAQQALDVIGRVFLNEGDPVVVENPTYLALLSAWRPLGARFLPVPSDTAGMRVDELEPLLAQHPKLIYSTPNFQNPQGGTLAVERRSRLHELLCQHDAVVVEDNAYGELRYDGEPLPHLLDLDGSEGRVIHVGTCSKTVAPGLRVGWIVAPAEAIQKLALAKQAMDLHTSTFCQYLLYELVRGHWLEEHLVQLRRTYRERRDTMFGALEKGFGSEATWTRPEGGMFLMLKLTAPVDAAELLKLALKQGVAFVPGEEFHVCGGGRNTLRLTFSNSSRELIEQGVKRLRAALDELHHKAPESLPFSP